MRKLIEWGITMHNHVNKSNGKKVYTYEEGMKEILNNKEQCNISKEPLTENFTNNNDNNVLYLSISIIIIILLVLYIIYYKK